jgi:hypothetical protein
MNEAKKKNQRTMVTDNLYMIVHTYNGVGYSDSKVEMVTVKDPDHHEIELCEYVSEHLCSGEEILISMDPDVVIYSDDDGCSYGRITMVKWDNHVRAVLYPDVNEFKLFKYHEIAQYLSCLKSLDILSKAGDSDELGELLANDEGGIHLEDGYVILQKITVK